MSINCDHKIEEIKFLSYRSENLVPKVKLEAEFIKSIHLFPTFKLYLMFTHFDTEISPLTAYHCDVLVAAKLKQELHPFQPASVIFPTPSRKKSRVHERKPPEFPLLNLNSSP